MAGEDAPKLYRTEEDRDGDFNGAVADQAVVDEAWRAWRAEIERTDRFLAGITDLATRNAGFSDYGPEPGGQVQLRDILVAQIAETHGTAATPASCANASTAASGSEREPLRKHFGGDVENPRPAPSPG